MLTKDQLDSIATFIIETAPGYDFLVLMTPKENERAMGVCSNLPNNLQPLMAAAFVAGHAGLATGQFGLNTFTKPH